MRKRIAALVTVPLLVLSVLVASTATAHVRPRFDWHVADAFIQEGTGLAQMGARAQADNGDFARISGAGTFNTRSGKATGGGVFAHTNSAGVLLGFGTWEAIGVEDFDFFGCGGGGFPDNFCGGDLTLSVHLTGVSLAVGQAAFDGVLTVTCLIGPDVPAGAEEGITLDLPGVIDFDDLVSETSGLTLFVAPS